MMMSINDRGLVSIYAYQSLAIMKTTGRCLFEPSITI